MSISSVAHGIFVEQGYVWKMGSERNIPTEDDIRICLDKMVEVLDSSDKDDTIEVGRLLVQETDEGYAVYIHLGDMPHGKDS